MQIFNRVIIRVTGRADEVYEGVVEQQLKLWVTTAEGKAGTLTLTMHNGDTHEYDVYLGSVLTWRNGGDLIIEE